MFSTEKVSCRIRRGTKSPTHLLLRGCIWYFRYAIPKPVQKLLGGLKEFKLSLQTGVVREAKLKAGKLAANAYDACLVFSEHASRLSEYSPAQLRLLLKEAILNGDVDSRLDFTARRKSHPEQKKISLSLPEDFEPRPVQTSFSPDTSGNNHTWEITVPTLSEALDAYYAEKVHTEAWTERTVKDFLPKLNFFLEHTGNAALQSLERNHIRSFKNILDKLPARFGLTKEFRDISLDEIIEGKVPVEKRMSPSSLGKYYGVINSFLIWIRNNYDNIQEGLEKILYIKVSKQVDLLRNTFSEGDIKLIFSSEEYRNDSFSSAHKYWVPLIGYYTGMRLEEICQLHVNDIKLAEGIWYFEINDLDDKKLKTQAAMRKIPIHPVLLEKFKIVDFVNRQKNKGEIRLFPELPKNSGRYSHYASRWFNGRYLFKVGIKKEKETGKVFHSFRHTFANACKIAGIEEYKAREILGHEISSKSITYGRYGKKYPLQVMYDDVIKKIDLLDVSLFMDG